MSTLKSQQRFSGCLRIFLIIFAVLILGFFVFVFPLLRKAIHAGESSKACSLAVVIGHSLDAYASDHNGKYPDGRSSTEVFQKLIDGGYVTDPFVFFGQMPGKVPATDKTLKPENVGWDLTSCSDSNPPENTPLVFSTGFKINYNASSPAVLRNRPSFLQDWNDEYLVVFYKGGRASLPRISPDGTIPNFIPADFDPKGKTYRQLTPDGELQP